MGARALVAAVAAAVALVPPAAAANEKPPRHDPTELWQAYPLGKPQQPAVSIPKTSRPSRPTSRPTTPVHSSTPLPQPESHDAFPVAAVSSVAGGAGALVLLAMLVLRRRRGGGGSPAVIVEPPPGRPPTDPIVMKVWPRDIESSVTVRVQRAIARRATDDAPPLPGESTRRAAAPVASTTSRWNTLGRQVLPRRRDPVSDESQEKVALGSTAETAESGGDVDIGERINGILRAAEEAAKQIRADAEYEAAGIRTRAEADATSHHASVLEQAKQVRQDADRYAVQKRHEVDAMAKQLEAEARHKRQDLEEGSRAIEVRLERLLGGIRETGSQLEAMIGGNRGESLVSALSVERQRLSTEDRNS